MILSHFRTAMLAAIPGLDAPKKAFYRVQRNILARLNLQAISPTLDQTKDLSNIEVCPGVPGVTSDPTPGETCIVMFVGKDGVPYVIARAAEGMPGHTPAEVRHDATSAIRMVSKAASVAAKVYVGSTTVAIAKAPQVEALDTALTTFATACKASADPALAAAALVLEGALNAISGYGTTKLEAE